MPSAKILATKQATVAELSEKLKNATSGVVVTYGGITVEDDTKLRAELRKAGVEYKVYKNTLIGRACDEAGYSQMKDSLSGMSAIATASDEVSAAKILKQYAEKVESFELKCGFVDGEYLDKAGVTALADTPSKEVLVCKVMGGLMSSLYGLAYALQAIIDKGEATPATEAAAE